MREMTRLRCHVAWSSVVLLAAGITLHEVTGNSGALAGAALLVLMVNAVHVAIHWVRELWHTNDRGGADG